MYISLLAAAATGMAMAMGFLKNFQLFFHGQLYGYRYTKCRKVYGHGMAADHIARYQLQVSNSCQIHSHLGSAGTGTYSYVGDTRRIQQQVYKPAAGECYENRECCIKAYACREPTGYSRPVLGIRGPVGDREGGPVGGLNIP
ncbi:hypothetical protein DFH27DRAFT_528149 [Peziza echinospora]|nr:hypothetical protein DFH27DRAFT_528149 [Peziza echinospora]